MIIPIAVALTLLMARKNHHTSPDREQLKGNLPAAQHEAAEPMKHMDGMEHAAPAEGVASSEGQMTSEEMKMTEGEKAAEPAMHEEKH